METILHILGPLQSYTGGIKELKIKPGMTVRETIVDLGILPEAVAFVSVNDEIQEKNYVIREGDSVRIMAVIGGG